jgi:RNA polymerase sigma-70 factor (ECF subfamily)
VLRLVAWDGLTPAELAVVLGCAPGAARARLHRARTRLAARLGISPDEQRRGLSGHKQGDSPDSVEVP